MANPTSKQIDWSSVSTPYGLDESLPNKERGILHIENGNYWKFYNLK